MCCLRNGLVVLLNCDRKMATQEGEKVTCSALEKKIIRQIEVSPAYRTISSFQVL